MLQKAKGKNNAKWMVLFFYLFILFVLRN
jgi:hypothetical protein